MRQGSCFKATRSRPEEAPVSLSKDGSEPEWGASIGNRAKSPVFIYPWNFPPLKPLHFFARSPWKSLLLLFSLCFNGFHNFTCVEPKSSRFFNRSESWRSDLQLRVVFYLNLFYYLIIKLSFAKAQIKMKANSERGKLHRPKLCKISFVPNMLLKFMIPK